MERTPDNFDVIGAALQLTIEDDFSYFCKYDDLTGVVASFSTELPAIADSCYISRADVFLPIKE